MTHKNMPEKSTNKKAVFHDLLLAAGLTADQIIIYELLVEHGPIRAQRLAFLSGFSRPLVYKVLDQLISGNLAEKLPAPDEKISMFAITNPQIIENLIEHKREDYEKARGLLDAHFSELVSKYNLNSGKPNVRFFEGAGGVIRLYKDILTERKDILLFRSFLDQTNSQSKNEVAKQIKAQASRGIHTRAITPFDKEIGGAKELTKDDESLLVERRLIDSDKFCLPAQIIVYGNKTALTSYNEHTITTITENKDMADSFRVLFELVWAQGMHPKSLGA